MSLPLLNGARNAREGLLFLLGLLFGAFYIYQAAFGLFSPQIHRGAFILFTIVLTILSKPLPLRQPWGGLVDASLAVASSASICYFMVEYNRFVLQAGLPLTNLDMAMGIIATIAVMEVCRRIIGWPLTVLGLLGLGYLFFGQHLGGILEHPGYSLSRIMSRIYASTEGIFGSVTAVFASFVLIFIIFGSMLEKFGAVQAFLQLARAMFRNVAGGPAKAAVFSSGMVGMVMGSGAANAVVTGAVTIPLMKGTGYRPHVAAAVEAVASSGGQILPPVMGAGAFLLAAIIGVPYFDVVVAAIIPAILFYIAVFAYVHFEAKKFQLGSGVTDDEELSLGRALIASAPHLLSILAIVIVLVQGFSPGRAAIAAMLTVLVVDLIRHRDPIRSLRLLIEACSEGARNALVVAAVAGVVGLIVVSVTMPGLTGQFAWIVIRLSGDFLPLALVLVMFVGIVMGVGLGAVPAYLITAVLGAPALAELGVPPMQAHLFIFWTSIIANVTPPVCIATFAAASIANADPWRSAVTGMRLAWPLYVLPYFFVYIPTLNMEGETAAIALDSITAAIAMVLLAAAIQGYWSYPLPWTSRILMSIGSVILMGPGITYPLLGAVFVVLAFLWAKRATATPQAST